MKTVIHVNQHIIKKNKKEQSKNPVITVKNYKKNIYSNNVKILDNDGKVVCTIKYSPDKPLKCGATVWIETKNKVLYNE